MAWSEAGEGILKHTDTPRIVASPEMSLSEPENYICPFIRGQIRKGETTLDQFQREDERMPEDDNYPDIRKGETTLDQFQPLLPLSQETIQSRLLA